MLRVVIMMIVGIAVGRALGTPLGVRESFCILMGLMALTALLRRYEVMSTVTMIAVNFAFGFFLITNSDHNGQVETLPLPGIDVVEEKMGDVRVFLTEAYREQGLADDEYAVVAAMTLGDRSSVTPELKETYSRSGAAHVFAVSGLHLGILWGLLALLLPVKAFPRSSGLLMVTAIWMYAFLVGLHASVVRATVMLSCYTLCKAMARDTDSVSVLTFTAFLLLVYNPQWLFDVGFQMSFLATASILIFSPTLMSIIPRRSRKTPQKVVRVLKVIKAIWGMVAVSLLAQLAVAPLIAYYFGRFSTYFLLTNFIVGPGAFIIIMLAVAVSGLTVFTWCIPFLSYPLDLCGWYLIAVVKIVNGSLNWIISLPHSTIEDIHISALQVAAVYVLLACVLLSLHHLRIRRRIEYLITRWNVQYQWNLKQD